MVNLRSIREKLSWQGVVFAALFLTAAVIFAGFYLPARKKAGELEEQLSQLVQNEQLLLGIVEQIPQLEAGQRQIEDRLLTSAKYIPSQYDLPEVLEGLRTLSTYYGLDIASLDHVPVKSEQGSETGIIPLVMAVQGSEKVFAYLLHIQEVLPSLKVTQVGLGYIGRGLFHLELTADLQVFMLDHAPATGLELAKLTREDLVDLPVQAFGLPFEIISQYLGRQVQVLGIVDFQSQRSALVSKEGKQYWLRAGDRLGEAVVREISSNGVYLDIDGVDLKLTIGG